MSSSGSVDVEGDLEAGRHEGVARGLGRAVAVRMLMGMPMRSASTSMAVVLVVAAQAQGEAGHEGVVERAADPLAGLLGQVQRAL